MAGRWPVGSRSVVEKTPVGGFKMILKRASGDCVEESET